LDREWQFNLRNQRVHLDFGFLKIQKIISFQIILK